MFVASIRYPFFLLLACLCVLTACAPLVTETPDSAVLYEKAKTDLRLANFHKAADKFESIESQFPFDPLAAKANLYAAYAYLKAEDSGAALAVIDRFLRIHPAHPHADYAQYLRGFIYYEDVFARPSRYFAIPASAKQHPHAHFAFNAFNELIKRYPNSRYADDARLRMVALRNIMADSEYRIAAFYCKKAAYLACADRAHAVIYRFYQSPAHPKALALLEKSYTQLHLQELLPPL